MSITWILVADGSRARLLESQRSGEPLHPLGDFANPAARRSTTGRPRSHHESVGCGRSISQSHRPPAHLLEPPAPQSASSGISDRADRTPLRTHPVTAPMTEPDRTPRSAGATMNRGPDTMRRGTNTRSHHVD